MTYICMCIHIYKHSSHGLLWLKSIIITLLYVATYIWYHKQLMLHSLARTCSLTYIQAPPCTRSSHKCLFFHIWVLSQSVLHMSSFMVYLLGKAACMFTLVATYSHWYRPWRLLGAYIITSCLPFKHKCGYSTNAITPQQINQHTWNHQHSILYWPCDNSNILGQANN